MADLSQVRDTIAQNIVTAIYPNGTSQPSVCGVPVTVNSGWPIATVLDQQLQLGNAMVSVYPTNQNRIVTKFQRIYIPNTLTPATITLTVASNTVTVGGTISVPQAPMIILNGIGYAYQVQATDTLSSIASALAGLISGATAVGNVINLPNYYSITTRVSSNYTASEELAREDRIFMITCWCPNENVRYLLGQAIDLYMKFSYRMPMPDNFFAQVFWHKTNDTDQLDKALIYRRDLIYTIQYATTYTNNFTPVSDFVVDVSSVTEIS
ncbi:MAG: hypothetical protein KGJ07_00020 [Patescibacteria group bacterium]|nr:hypothetical protein [Patescibacteria group bacterium]